MSSLFDTSFYIMEKVWNEMLSIMNKKQAEEISGMPLANKGITFSKIYWIFILFVVAL